MTHQDATIPIHTLLHLVTLAVTNPAYNVEKDGVKIDLALRAIFRGK